MLALCQSGHMSAINLIDILPCFKTEQSQCVWEILVKIVHKIAMLVEGEPEEKKFNGILKGMFEILKIIV